LSAKTDLWQGNARDLLEDAVALRDLNSRQLAELLAEYGVKIKPKTLLRRISRGTFGADFWLLCLMALGAKRVVVGTSQKYEVLFKSERTWRRDRLKRQVQK